MKIIKCFLMLNFVSTHAIVAFKGFSNMNHEKWKKKIALLIITKNLKSQSFGKVRM